MLLCSITKKKTGWTWRQPPPQALRFSHGRGERETRVTGDEPQGTMGRVQTARTSKERRLGTRHVPCEGIAEEVSF